MVSRSYVTCDDIMDLLANGMFLYVSLCFKMFSISFSIVAKISPYKAHVEISLVVQGLRIHLPMQGIQVRSLV